MCTVTYVPVKGKFFITSNRDEKSVRNKAVLPQVYNYGEYKLIFPKDANAGGTWIAAHENGNIIVLLNGGFVKHNYEPPYRKSRGIILLDIINNDKPVNAFNTIDLERIEPFTIIIASYKKLHECRWDGKQKHTKEIDYKVPHIWSSVTLYDSNIIAKREGWFKEWINNNKHFAMHNIVQFHLFTGDGDTNNDLKMNRNNDMLTVSITSVEVTNTKATMYYKDLQDNIEHTQELSFQPDFVLS